MYKEVSFPSSVLIVKTSSLGDIIQAFHVLDDLHRRLPGVAIDWAVEAPFASLVAAHPLIHRAIPLHLKKKKYLFNDLRALRREKYDLLFDLQGNSKSGLITWLARAKVKIGYALKSVREWPNVLATHVRFEVSKQRNIRLYYLGLIESYFGEPTSSKNEGVRFLISDAEKEGVARIVSQAPSRYKMMVCPGSKWINKRLPLDTLVAFLQKVEERDRASFFLVWGDAEEKVFCEEMVKRVKNSFVVDKLPLLSWQNLMHEMDLVIAVDSSALHLCGTTSTPSFSIFGPTSPNIFKPMGEKHVALQGKCPYNTPFEKQCPLLRTCPTGACIKSLTAEQLFEAYLLSRRKE